MDRAFTRTFHHSECVMNGQSYKVWDEVKERFSHGDLFRILDLQDEITSLKQGELLVTKYFMKLKIL